MQNAHTKWIGIGLLVLVSIAVTQYWNPSSAPLESDAPSRPTEEGKFAEEKGHPDPSPPSLARNTPSDPGRQPSPASPTAITSDTQLNGMNIVSVLDESVSALTKRQTQRVRIVETDYRFPFLRIEETFEVSPATGTQRRIGWKAAPADRVLVKRQGGAAAQALIEHLERQGYDHLGANDTFHTVGLPSFEKTDALPKALQALLQERQLIQVAEPDYLLRLFQRAPNDPMVSGNRLWGLENYGGNGYVEDADIDAPEAWAHRHEAADVVVAVIDSGLRATHEDLQDNLWIREMSR